jgi:glutathione S-transferase
MRAIAAKVRSAVIGPQLQTHFDFVEGELARHECFVGNNFSAADIQMSFVVEAAVARGEGGPARPHLQKFLDKIHERPAYKRALEKGGPFSLMK